MGRNEIQSRKKKAACYSEMLVSIYETASVTARKTVYKLRLLSAVSVPRAEIAKLMKALTVIVDW
jgi:hypothetical protein